MERGAGGKGSWRKGWRENFGQDVNTITIFKRKICTYIRAYSSINIIVLNKPRNYLKISGKGV